MMIYGPIKESLEEFNVNEDLSRQVWMMIHEISHSLLEGSAGLVAKGAISDENRKELNGYATCLNQISPGPVSEDMKELLQKAQGHFQNGKVEGVGYVYAEIALAKCPR